MIKMDFKIDFGPWEPVFHGDFLRHETEIIMNPEKFFLIIIYEKDNLKEGNMGAVFQGYKAMVAKGNLDSFISTIPKPVLGITKTNGESTKKMIFISFNPVYIDFKQEDFIRKVDNEIKKSYTDINNIIELAKSSGLKLQDTTTASEEDYAPILSDPMTARLLMSGLRKSSLELMSLPTKQKNNEDKTIQVGLNKKREIIKEESKNFYRSIIIGENKISVNYSLYILNENLLLDNNATIIFDEDNYFSGLGNASQNEMILKENLIEYEPSGFPVKKFEAKKDIKVSLKNCDISLMLNLFETGDKDFETLLKNNPAIKDTPKDTITNITEFKNLNEFQKLKLERMLYIFDNNFTDFFGTQFDISQLTKKWSENLGRASIININQLNEFEKLIFIDYILNSIKTVNEQTQNVIITIPNIDNLIKTEKTKFLEEISLLENNGFGFLFGTKKLPFEMEQLVLTKITVVKGNDVAVTSKGNRNYRVNLRPNLSGNIKSE